MADLPIDIIESAERLTRLARRAVDENEAAAYRQERDETLAEYEYVAHVREEESETILVCYPDDWLDDGTVQIDRIEDTDRAIERPLDGAGGDRDYEQIDGYNRGIVQEVRETAGQVHAANANAFADFMGNHYLRRVDSASAAAVEEFLTEYFPRNAWPSEEQRQIVRESLRLVFDVVDSPPPATLRDDAEDEADRMGSDA